MAGIWLLASTAAAQVDTDSAEEQRTSVSVHHVTGGRDSSDNLVRTDEEYAPLVTEGERTNKDTRSGSSKPGDGSTRMESSSLDFWFYAADVQLFNDDDGDGYYHGIDLLFDADTNYTSADVYAVLYLSYEGGPWNEYASTEDFTIYGASSDDEYNIVSELQSGYPTGSYDILIELFDAYDGAYLAGFGPSDTPELAFLNLEDYNRDAPAPVRTVVVTRGGGGSIDGWFIGAFLLLLFGSAARRIWLHRDDALRRIDSPAPCWQRRDEPDQRIRF